MTTEKKKLPALIDLYNGNLELKKDQNELNILLNQSPKSEWIKVLPDNVAKGVKYLPIERVEYLLTRLFIKWRVEVKDVKIIANSVAVTIRLHYQNIEDNEWSWQDGVGAVPIQTEKGAGAMDWDKTKSSAVMKALPAAKSLAKKDAAEEIGKIFGKDLNRKDEIAYDTLSDAIPEEKISISQIGYAEELIRKSTLDETQKQIAELELNENISFAEYNALINKLKDAQTKKY